VDLFVGMDVGGTRARVAATPVADRTRVAVGERWPGCVRVAGDPAVAGARLASAWAQG
jgi:hypothetical protein